MRKRSEVTKPKKSTAAERTAPMQYTDPSASVTCAICEHVAIVKDCTARDNGVLECPACGAPIEGAATSAVTTKTEPEEDIPFPETETLTKPSEKPAPRKPMFESKNEIAKQDAMLKDAILPGHEPPPKTYCKKCGAEWAIVNGKLWSNCGHDEGSVDNPNKVDRYMPPAGSARATVVGRTLHVTRGKATFPTVAYGSFHVGPFSVSIEMGPDAHVVDLARAIRADLKKIADEAFEEELAWYEQKFKILSKGE